MKINIIKKIKGENDYFKIKRKFSFKALSLKSIKNRINTFIHSLLFKIIIVMIIILIIFIKEIYILYFRDYKVCLCVVGKIENNYAVEFVEHYKKYGIDKIIIYDNNDRNGERFESVLSEYIDNKSVKIVNVRGRKRIQIDAFNHCNWQNYKKYNWLIFFDFDEFIYLKNNTNIKTFLKNKKFDECKVITLNELVHTDNNQIYYENRSVVERFPEVNLNRTPIMLKSRLRGRIEHQQIYNNHVIRINSIGCDGFGVKVNLSSIYRSNPDFTTNYFDHYFTKSAEEYLIKTSKGDVFWGKLGRKMDINYISIYFDYNKITLEKINFFENRTGIKLPNIRAKLKRSNNT